MGASGAPALAGTRQYRHHHLDSTRWEHVPFRADDIVVTTPYKCGTTWTQRILGGLLHGPDRSVDRGLSPWVDARFWGPIAPIAEALNAQPHRRFIKSHLALDGMPWDDRVSFIVVGRDPRDVFMSLLNHYAAYTDMAFSRFADGNPGDPLPPYAGDPHDLWRSWIGRGWFPWERDGWPFWSAFHHLETWWTARDRPNVLFLHYNDLLADLRGEIERLARFLGLEPSREELDAVTEASTFAAMKEQYLKVEADAGGSTGGFFAGGVQTFFHKGTNGRWRELLTDEELDAYDRRASELDPALRTWLECGRLRDVD